MILVIDIGSSSVRALLFDENMQLVPNAMIRRPHQFTVDPTGAATLEMHTLQQRVESCIDEILQHPAASKIRVVGMATFVGNLIGIDATGQAITPIYSYADTRSSEDLAHFATQIDLAATHQRTGCVHHTAYHPSRLQWLKRSQPDLFSHVHTWLDLATYLYRAWFGAAACSYSVASWSGLFNRHDCAWDSEWLEILQLNASQFPPLTDYDKLQTGLQATYATRWPQLKNVPFCLAVGDGAAANLGSGCVDNRHIALTVGTSAAIRMLSPVAQTLPTALWEYRLTQAQHLIGGATSEGGNIHQWLNKTLNMQALSDYESLLAEREADSHGLTILPLLAGERSPNFAPDATGAIIGLRLSTTPLDILHAALEAVALRLAIIAEQLLPLAHPDAAFIVSGGALLASPAWTQMIANALNRPLHITPDPEITARGVAILALNAIEAVDINAFAPTITHTIIPQAQAVARLQAAQARQIDLYHKLISKSLAE